MFLVTEHNPCGPAENSASTGPIKPPRSLIYRAAKRGFDLLAAGVGLIVLTPVLLLIMAAVKFTSPGPAIYVQKRLGRRGRIYTIYKIRSMTHNCEHATGARWAVKNDARVTPIGYYLRRYHLDELPQLLNVVRGEMSLVGPRPERPEIVEQLEFAIPRYRDRMLVRPGLTGLAQVQLPPDTDLASVQRKVACDLYYVQHMSLWLDLRILLSTASYLVGIPFWVPRTILQVPSGETVEASYRSLASDTPQVRPA